MSTNTIVTALDFMPAERNARQPHGVWGSLRAFFACIGQGLDAARRYERLTVQGTPPQEAVEIVFREHFADRR